MQKGTKRKLDLLWAKMVKRGGYCKITGNRSCKLDAHHIEGKSNLFLRYSYFNGICISAKLHRFGAHSVSYSDQQNFHGRLKLVVPEEVLSYLEFARKFNCKYPEVDAEELGKRMKAIIAADPLGLDPPIDLISDYHKFMLGFIL